MNKRSLSSILLACCIALAAANAQDSGTLPPESKATGFSIGAALGDFSDDLALGGEISSPFFLWGHAAARASVYYAFHKAVLASSPDETWLGYIVADVNLIGASGMIGGFARFYGYGGGVVAYTEGNLGPATWNFGGRGGFGFEFFPASFISYAIELGTIGFGGHATSLPSNPLLLQGFSTRVALRVYF